MKKARTITLVLAAAALIICCACLNLMGSFAFMSYKGYEKCGYALIISSLLLTASYIIAVYKKVIIPMLLNIAGSWFYIYVLAFLSAIPNTKIPRENIERLMGKHYPTVIVTVLLTLLIFFNFMSEEAVKKRSEAKKARKAAKERQLTDDEKIV